MAHLMKMEILLLIQLFIDLAFLETADITGTISDIPGGVQIHLWMDDSEEL